MRFQFMLSEIKIGIQRNLTMTISLILVTMVSMVLFGLGMLTHQQVNMMSTYWNDQVQVSIFMCTKDSDKTLCPAGEATQAQKNAVLNDLNSPQLKQYIEEYTFVDKNEAFKRFQEQYKNSILSQNVRVDQMPESYQVKLKDPRNNQVIASSFANKAGVDSVKDQDRLIENLFKLFRGMQWLAWGLAGLTLLSSVLLVATTIRLTAFTRRRETAIMRLVGASNWTIRMPFVLESMFATVVGVLLATIVILLVTIFGINKWLAGLLKFIAGWVDWTDALMVAPWMLLIGLLISGVSSSLVLRRYLKV